jgi:hypothetical protein
MMNSIAGESTVAATARRNGIRNRVWRASVVALVLIVTWSVSTQAQIIFVFQQGLNGYEGTADTFVQTGDPFAVHGDETEWEWDGSDAGGANFGFLRFDDIVGAKSGQIPPGSTVLSAILSLTITSAGTESEIATVHDLIKPFTEEMSLADFTEELEPLVGVEYIEDVVAEIPGPPSGVVIEVDVTSSLKRWVAGESNQGWIFVPGGSNGVGAISSESSPTLLPTLEVNTPVGIFVFRDGEKGYNGTADTWINNGTDIDTVQGEENYFGFDGSDAGGKNYGLLRFDDIIGTGAGQIPPGTTITSAKILLSIVDSGDAGTLHEILPGPADQPTYFDDANTTCTTFGDGYEPWPGVHYAEDPVADVPGESGRIELDVTATVQKYSNGEKNMGWIFVPTGTDGVDITSSEATPGGGPPKLTVTIQGPASVADYSIY